MLKLELEVVVEEEEFVAELVERMLDGAIGVVEDSSNCSLRFEWSCSIHRSLYSSRAIR